MGMRVLFIGLLLILTGLGCAGSIDHQPLAPPEKTDSVKPVTDSAGSSRSLLGLWTITIDPLAQTAEIVSERSSEMHMNVLKLLEVAPCKNCLTIGNVKHVGLQILSFDLTLRHPFQALVKFTGFDVRGIFITQADFTFPESQRNIALGDLAVSMLNPDGYSALFNPTEFPPTTPPELGYIKGKYAKDGDLSSTLNPFVAYRKDAPRCMFEAGGQETRKILLAVPGGIPFNIGYAVDSCWKKVTGPIIDPLKDFPPDANCLEAYRIDVNFPSSLEPVPGSEVPISVEVFDHQGLDTISAVTMESPGVFSGEKALTLSTQISDESWLFTGTVSNDFAVPDGDYPLLVRVVDTQPDQNLGEIDAWQVASVGVWSGWARTWGGESYDESDGVAVDSSGNVYVVGNFKGTVDLDPGDGTDYHSTQSLNYDNVFLSKFDSSGTFQWTRTWDPDSFYPMLHGSAVAVDPSGNVFVTGNFGGDVDFDPGSGTDFHGSNGARDIFVSKFDSEGIFQWAVTWGGDADTYGDYCEGLGVAADSLGNVFVSGYFQSHVGPVDFDPGPGEDFHESYKLSDAFLSKFDGSGVFQWARTWGGFGHENGNGVAVDPNGNVLVTGDFYWTVDFDPGSGVDNHDAISGTDIYLSKFDTSGAFQWARTWGAVFDPDDEWDTLDDGHGVTADSSGNIYVTGLFGGACDFDPGSGVDFHKSNGSYDAFLSKFDPSGNYLWAQTWGGISPDEGLGVATDPSGFVYVTGDFCYTADFDPGDGVDAHTAFHYQDAFVSKFDPSGVFQWAKNWGGGVGKENLGSGIGVDQSGTAFVTGNFYGTADLDPYGGVDNHTSNGERDVFLLRL
jgi:hypothetical protein